MNKEYFQIYYQDHKEEYKKRHKEWNKNNPEGKKKIKKTYYETHREELLKYSREYRENKIKGTFIPERRRVLGVRIKEKELKPFMQRISPELRSKIEENTKVNNDKIKHYSMNDTKDNYLVRSLMKMKETRRV